MSITLDGTLGITTPTYGGTTTAEYSVPVTGFKNRIINGAMGIWQRGTTYALTTTIAYGSVDRFAGLQATVANGVLSQVASGLTGFTYALKLGRNNAATGTGILEIAQAIESSNSMDLQGNTATISFWAKAGTNFSATSSLITVQLASGTGTDQSVASQVGGSWTGVTYPINTTQAITTTWTRYTFTGTMPSNTNQAGIQIYYTPVGTAGADDNLYITGVQLEKGSTATSFDYRPYGTELQLCQRYYTRSTAVAAGDYLGLGGVASSTTARLYQPFIMRSTPTISYAATLTITDGGVAPTITSITGASNVGTGIQFIINASGGGLTTSRAGGIRSSNTTDYIDYSSEL